MKKLEYIGLSIVIGVLLALGASYYIKYTKVKDNINPPLIEDIIPKKDSINTDSIKITELGNEIKRLVLKNKNIVEQSKISQQKFERIMKEYYDGQTLSEVPDNTLCDSITYEYNQLLRINNKNENQIGYLKENLDNLAVNIDSLKNVTDEQKLVLEDREVIINGYKKEYDDILAKYNKQNLLLQDSINREIASKKKKKINVWTVVAAAAGILVGKKL